MDALNIVACFAVVVLHSTTLVFAPSADTSWIIALIGQSICIFAVPIFFMVSGANLINYRARYSTEKFFKKRFTKVLGALLLASALSYVVFCTFPYSFYGAQSFAGSFGLIDFTKRFLTNGIVDVYWFMYAIIYLYMLAPVLSKLSDDKRCLQYVIGLCLLVAFAIPLVNHYVLNAKYTEMLFAWPLFGSVNLLYFLLGYYLNSFCSLEGKKKRILVIALALISVLAMATLGYIANEGGRAMAYDNYWVGISSPFCVLLAASLFFLFKSLEPFWTRSSLLVHWLPKISGVTLWVYLLHMLVINWININAPSSIIELFRIMPLAEAILVFVVTLIFVMLAKFVYGHFKSGLKRVTYRMKS